MASAIGSCKPDASILNLCSITCPFDILIRILAENVLVALEWEAMLVRAMFRLNNNARRALTSVEKQTFPRSKRPEMVINGPCSERMDVKNADNARTVEHAGGKKGRRKRKSDRDDERKEKEKAAKQDKEEKERLREWEERWEKKLQAQEELDNIECCMDRGLCLKPRTQSSIWINVLRDRSIQEIRMAFKHVPVPRPKPPPLPSLRKQPASDNVRVEKTVVQKVDKKSGTTKRKKK